MRKTSLLLALGAAAMAATAVTAPASAAEADTSSGCPRDYLCLYSGYGFTNLRSTIWKNVGEFTTNPPFVTGSYHNNSDRRMCLHPRDGGPWTLQPGAQNGSVDFGSSGIVRIVPC